jgi:hypothetical protein
MDQVYGKDAPLDVIADDSKLDSFIQEANKLPPPLILGMVIQASDDEEKETKGLRFMGQRFIPDAFIFRQLIYRNVSTPDNRRGLPMGLDLFAAMGLNGLIGSSISLVKHNMKSTWNRWKVWDGEQPGGWRIGQRLCTTPGCIVSNLDRSSRTKLSILHALPRLA